MKKISIVSVYNRQDLLEQMRKSIFSRGGGTHESCEVIALDNTNGQFPSAAMAYNYALNNLVTGDCVIFCHQDIIFLEGAIQAIRDLCESEPNTLFGAAGVKNDGHGKKDRIISSMASVKEGWNYETLQKGTTENVFTLDECLIAAHKSIFEKIHFDPVICDGWHFYAVELCLQCHVNNILVKVFDANIVHLSGGNPDKTFYACERRIVEKYRDDFKLISYTCGWAYTNPLKYSLLRLYRRVRYKVK